MGGEIEGNLRIDRVRHQTPHERTGVKVDILRLLEGPSQHPLCRGPSSGLVSLPPLTSDYAPPFDSCLAKLQVDPSRRQDASNSVK